MSGFGNSDAASLQPKTCLGDVALGGIVPYQQQGDAGVIRFQAGNTGIASGTHHHSECRCQHCEPCSQLTLLHMPLLYALVSILCNETVSTLTSCKVSSAAHDVDEKDSPIVWTLSSNIWTVPHSRSHCFENSW
jgi:hypothetical protein